MGGFENSPNGSMRYTGGTTASTAIMINRNSRSQTATRGSPGPLVCLLAVATGSADLSLIWIKGSKLLIDETSALLAGNDNEHQSNIITHPSYCTRQPAVARKFGYRAPAAGTRIKSSLQYR